MSRLRRHLAVTVRAGMALVCWLSAALPAHAGHGKVDVVEFVNGDRLTGEIKNLQRGKLTVKTNGMGTISIEWERVRRIASPATYTVELSSGVRLLGIISSPADRQLRVTAGSMVFTAVMTSVVAIDPIETGFWGRLDGSIDFGFTFTQADKRRQWSLNAETQRRSPRFLVHGALNALQTLQTSADEQRRIAFTALVERFLARRWFAAALAQLNENEDLGLRLRTVTGGGLGRYLARSNRNEFAVLGAVSYTRERFVDVPGENRLEAILAAAWDWFTFGDRETTISTAVQTYYALNGERRFRLELTSNLRRKFYKDFYWSTDVNESFDSSPPNGQKRNDVNVTAALGWSF